MVPNIRVRRPPTPQRPGAREHPGNVMFHRRVVVCADHLLVVESVGAALSSAGFEVETVEGWPVDAVGLVSRTGVGVLLCDLEPAARLEEARALVRSTQLAWLVLSGAPRGPAWGGMIEAGAGAVLPSTVSMERLQSAIESVGRGGHISDPAEQRALVDAWRVVDLGRCQVLGRVRSLTPRELAVLRALHTGQSVSLIAERAGVAPATVRSQVQAVLHKLGVRTQLAAVAVFDAVRTDVDDPTHARDAC